MHFLGLNISLSRNQNSKIKNQKSFDPAAWLRGEEHPDPGPPLLTNGYQQVAWVYAAANAIAQQVANIPFVFSRGPRGKENLITSGPLLDFYNQPHPGMNRFQYWENRVLWLLLRGECFRIPIYEDQPLPGLGQEPPSRQSAFGGLKYSGVGHPSRILDQSPVPAIKNQKSKIKNILMPDPARFLPIIENHTLQGWRYTGAHNDQLESQVFLPEEVWFERLPNPFDPWRGLAPFIAAGAAASTDFAAASFMRGIVENNAQNGLIVRAESHLSDEQREQISAALRNRTTRAGVPSRSLLLWGATEIIQPRLSSADIQFLENRKFSRSEICAAFGIPEEIVSTSDHNKYDVMQGARLNFIENRIAPLCARLEAEENSTTIPAIMNSAGNSEASLAWGRETEVRGHPLPSDGRGAGGEGSGERGPIENQKSKIENVTGWFDLDSLPIMQQARRDRLAAAKTGFDMGVPFNELNRVFDLGFTPLPWGDQGYLPSQLQPLPDAAPGKQYTPLGSPRNQNGIPTSPK